LHKTSQNPQKTYSFQNWHATCTEQGMNRTSGSVRKFNLWANRGFIMSTVSVFSNYGMKAAAGIFAIAATFGTVATVRAETGNGDFRAAVETSIDQEMRLPHSMNNKRHGVATVAVTIDGAGNVQSTHIVKSSGYGSFDQEAIRTARTVTYPASGKNRTVAVVLGFNEKVKTHAQVEGRALVAAWAKDQRVLMADKNATAQPDS